MLPTWALLFVRGGYRMASEFLDAWRLRWQRGGLATHPLMPAGGGWKGKEQLSDCVDLAPGEQWEWAYSRGDFWNMGVLPGSGYVVGDCDTPATVANMRAGFDGLGLRYGLEETPSGGAHLWIRVGDMPPEVGDVMQLASEVGRGSLLTGRANVAVTCSLGANGKRYRFPTGGPEELPGLPVVHFRDMTWLLPVTVGQAPARPPAVDSLPLRLLRRDASGVVETLRDLMGWEAATPYKGYASSSEAEAGAVARLILAGWDYGEIRAAFDKFSPGAFIRRLKRRYSWLRLTYGNVLSAVAATAPRPEIARAYQGVQAAAWPGKGGLLDRAVLSGLLALCWQCGRWQVYASERDLAEYAAASRHGVRNALARLHAAGLIRRVMFSNGTALYDVSGAASFGTIGHRGVSDSSAGKDEKVGVAEHGARAGGARAPVMLPGGSELWSMALLGRSAGAVYGLLGDAAAGAGELAERSGKGRRTVERALDRLRSCGLAERSAAGWVRGAEDPAVVAIAGGAPAAARMRHERHERERLAWSYRKWRAER